MTVSPTGFIRSGKRVRAENSLQVDGEERSGRGRAGSELLNMLTGPHASYRYMRRVRSSGPIQSWYLMYVQMFPLSIRLVASRYSADSINSRCGIS